MDKQTSALALTIFAAAESIKAQDIIGVDLSTVESYTDFVTIASGGSDRQVVSIADNVIKSVFKKHHIHPLGVEGYEAAEWVLIDFGEVVVHVFQQSVRDHYHLEDMWMQVKSISQDEFVKTVKASVVKKVVRSRASVKTKRKK